MRREARPYPIRNRPESPQTGAGITLYLAKASTSPATTTTTGWAAELAASAVGEFVNSLVPQSAAAQLIEMGQKASLDGRYTVAYPRRLGLPGTVPFVLQGGAIPVVQRDLTAIVLGPATKLAIISAFTQELAERSAVESAVTTILREDAASSLDATIFSNVAASASRPAGILNGITPLTATAGGTATAMATDIRALISAVVAAGGGSQIVFFANPVRAAAMALIGNAPFPYKVIPTRALAADALVALDPGAFTSGFGAEPRVDISGDAVLHFDDTTPLAIGTVDTTNTVAAPSRSLFQTASIGCD